MFACFIFNHQSRSLTSFSSPRAPRTKKRKVYAGLRPRAFREGSLTSRLAGASPRAPEPSLDTASQGERQKQS
eukprot:1145490-Pelagomonas_calceolata.AAC.4